MVSSKNNFKDFARKIIGNDVFINACMYGVNVMAVFILILTIIGNQRIRLHYTRKRDK